CGRKCTARRAIGGIDCQWYYRRYWWYRDFLTADRYSLFVYSHHGRDGVYEPCCLFDGPLAEAIWIKREIRNSIDVWCGLCYPGSHGGPQYRKSYVTPTHYFSDAIYHLFGSLTDLHCHYCTCYSRTDLFRFQSAGLGAVWHVSVGYCSSVVVVFGTQ